MKCKVCNNNLKEYKLDSNFIIHKCSCGYINRNLNISNQNIREYAYGGNSLFDKFRLFLTYQRIKKYANKNSKVLDIGFGDGKLLRKFYNNGNEIFGIDPNLLNIPVDQIVKENGKLYNDISTCDFSDNYFDLIYMVHTIEHIENFDLVLNKCGKWLKYGGILYIITPNSESFGLKIFGKHWCNFEDPTHIQFFSKESLDIALLLNNLFLYKSKRLKRDSLMYEINSLLRLFNKSGKSGILSNRFIPFVNLILLPFSILLRFCLNSSSSVEVFAKKNL